VLIWDKSNSTSVKLDETCELVLEGVVNIKNENSGLQHVIEENYSAEIYIFR
jgi:hypothetical protein